MLLSCTIVGQSCSSKDFEWSYHFYSGNCYTINSGHDSDGKDQPIRQVTQNLDGLYLELIVDSHNQALGETDGVVVYISDQKENVFENPELFLPKSFLSRLSLSKTSYEKLGPPHSNCVTDNLHQASTHLFKQTLSLNHSYSQSTCMFLCYQEFLIRDCSCFDPRFIATGDVRQCLNFDDMNCIFRTYAEFSKGNKSKRVFGFLVKYKYFFFSQEVSTVTAWSNVALNAPRGILRHQFLVSATQPGRVPLSS